MPFTVSLNISASSGRRRMILPPFDAAWRGDSNELCRILLRSLDAEIFKRNGKWRSNVNVKCRIVDVSLNISTSSGRRRLKLPPFVAAQWGDSNELRYILLRSLDAKIFNEKHFYNFEFWNLNQNCQISSVLIGLNLNWSDFDQIQTELNWTD